MPLILSFAFVFLEYGRSCKDIGCLPREVCIMAYESCSFGQQENSNCGRYPTCKKNTDQAATQQNTGNVIYHNYKWVEGLANKTKQLPQQLSIEFCVFGILVKLINTRGEMSYKWN